MKIYEIIKSKDLDPSDIFNAIDIDNNLLLDINEIK